MIPPLSDSRQSTWVGSLLNGDAFPSLNIPLFLPPDLMSYSLVSGVANVTLLTLVAATVLDCVNYRFVYKLCTEQKGGLKLYLQSILLNLVNQGVIAPLFLSLSLRPLFLANGLANSVKDGVHDPCPYLKWWEEPECSPFIYVSITEVLGMLVVHSIWYYGFHKWMHVTKIGWRMHAFHHRFKDIVVPMAAHAVTPFEYIGAYMFPVVLGAFLTGANRPSIFLAALIIEATVLLIHFPLLEEWSETYLPRWVVATWAHMEHHKLFLVHYAAPTFNIDRWLERNAGKRIGGREKSRNRTENDPLLLEECSTFIFLFICTVLGMYCSSTLLVDREGYHHYQYLRSFIISLLFFFAFYRVTGVILRRVVAPEKNYAKIFGGLNLGKSPQLPRKDSSKNTEINMFGTEEERIALRETLTAGDIFLTGATGFVGMHLLVYYLEALRVLKATNDRTCKEKLASRRIFCLIRAKSYKGKRQNAEERLFSLLKRHKALTVSLEFAKEHIRIVNLDGGLSDSTPTIPKRVRWVIHCACSTSFTQPLYDAMREICLFSLKLHEQARQQNANFLYVSTAFVHPKPTPIHSPSKLPKTQIRFYQNDREISPEDLADDILQNNGKLATEVMRSMGYSNTYAFSKALTERLLTTKHTDEILQEPNADTTLLRIVRLSIVVPALEFPSVGWVVDRPTPLLNCAALMVSHHAGVLWLEDSSVDGDLEGADKDTHKYDPKVRAASPIIPVDIASRLCFQVLSQSTRDLITNEDPQSENVFVGSLPESWQSTTRLNAANIYLSALMTRSLFLRRLTETLSETLKAFPFSTLKQRIWFGKTTQYFMNTFLLEVLYIVLFRAPFLSLVVRAFDAVSPRLGLCISWEKYQKKLSQLIGVSHLPSVVQPFASPIFHGLCGWEFESDTNYTFAQEEITPMLIRASFSFSYVQRFLACESSVSQTRVPLSEALLMNLSKRSFWKDDLLSFFSEGLSFSEYCQRVCSGWVVHKKANFGSGRSLILDLGSRGTQQAFGARLHDENFANKHSEKCLILCKTDELVNVQSAVEYAVSVVGSGTLIPSNTAVKNIPQENSSTVVTGILSEFSATTKGRGKVVLCAAVFKSSHRQLQLDFQSVFCVSDIDSVVHLSQFCTSKQVILTRKSISFSSEEDTYISSSDEEGLFHSEILSESTRIAAIPRSKDLKILQTFFSAGSDFEKESEKEESLKNTINAERNPENSANLESPPTVIVFREIAENMEVEKTKKLSEVSTGDALGSITKCSSKVKTRLTMFPKLFSFSRRHRLILLALLWISSIAYDFLFVVPPSLRQALFSHGNIKDVFSFTCLLSYGSIMRAFFNVEEAFLPQPQFAEGELRRPLVILAHQRSASTTVHSTLLKMKVKQAPEFAFFTFEEVLAPSILYRAVIYGSIHKLKVALVGAPEESEVKGHPIKLSNPEEDDMALLHRYRGVIMNTLLSAGVLDAVWRRPEILYSLTDGDGDYLRARIQRKLWWVSRFKEKTTEGSSIQWIGKPIATMTFWGRDQLSRVYGKDAHQLFLARDNVHDMFDSWFALCEEFGWQPSGTEAEARQIMWDYYTTPLLKGIESEFSRKPNKKRIWFSEIIGSKGRMLASIFQENILSPDSTSSSTCYESDMKCNNSGSKFTLASDAQDGSLASQVTRILAESKREARKSRDDPNRTRRESGSMQIVFACTILLQAIAAWALVYGFLVLTEGILRIFVCYPSLWSRNTKF